MVKDTFFRKKRFITLRGKLFDLSLPRIMGILNVTPDSFYDGGFYEKPDQLRKKVNELLMSGADIIDVGGYSSRPHAKDISEKEELARITPALEMIRKEFPGTIISVDTFRSGVAKKVIREFQIDIINDISGGTLDPEMPATIAELKVPYILMHMQGTPRTMQDNPSYENVVKEIIEFLGRQSGRLKKEGLNDIIIDPGFGFGKTIEQNFQILYQLDTFRILELPVIVGISRKSMIYRFLDIKPEEALNGTTALHMMALERGADILRVHDVKEAKETIELYCKAKVEGERGV
jgi:dihydropteroate synthase